MLMLLLTPKGNFDSGVADAMVRSIAVDFHPTCFVLINPRDKVFTSFD